MKSINHIDWYGNVRNAVMSGIKKARDCVLSGDVRNAMNHLQIADTVIILYENSLIRKGARNYSRIARGLRKQVTRTYGLICVEAAA